MYTAILQEKHKYIFIKGIAYIVILRHNLLKRILKAYIKKIRLLFFKILLKFLTFNRYKMVFGCFVSFCNSNYIQI